MAAPQFLPLPPGKRGYEQFLKPTAQLAYRPPKGLSRLPVAAKLSRRAVIGGIGGYGAYKIARAQKSSYVKLAARLAKIFGL